MKKFIALAALATIAFAAPAIAEPVQSVDAGATAAINDSLEVKAGQMLYSGEGRRLSQVDRVLKSGDAQIIMSGRFVAVPRSSLAMVDGKLMTSMTRKEVERIR